jgi:HAD superfamily hydrolase (TIGR01549 family)
VLKAMLLDFDGVVVNSTTMGMDNHLRIMKMLKLRLPTRDQLRRYWGDGWHNLVAALGRERKWTANQVKLFKQTYNEVVVENSYPRFRGLAGIYQLLRNEGVLLYIASNRDEASLKYHLRQVGLSEELFEGIFSLENREPKKPDPAALEIIFKELRQKKIKPQEIVFVGDTVNFDLKMVRRCKPPIHFLGVVSGVATKAEFLAAGLEEKFILEAGVDYPKRLPKILAEM